LSIVEFFNGFDTRVTQHVDKSNEGWYIDGFHVSFCFKKSLKIPKW
jgi:hypothetical protein